MTDRVAYYPRGLRGLRLAYGDLYRGLLRVPGAALLLSGAYWAVPIPLPGSTLYKICEELRVPVLHTVE